MRPAGRAELDSLYFDYPHFDPPSAREQSADPVPVAIVGAGPVGLTAALALARQGVRSVVLDAKSTFNDGSRAICISRSSFYILDAIGALPPFERKALPWTTGRSFYRGRQFLEFQMPDNAAERFRPMYNLQQQHIERYLWEAAAASPLIELRWQSEVIGLEDRDDAGITLKVRDPNGAYELQAEWALAADGARSAMRRLKGLRLEGENYEGRYVIADIRMAHDYPTVRRALFDPACRPGGTVLIHKQPDDIWRIDYQLAPDETNEAATTESEVRRNVDAVLGEVGHDGGYELEWWSVYSANTLALDDYRHGRVFFIGDSAHIVPIFGVRGLNNGFADAENIAWKLGWVLRGLAGPRLLDSYTPERRGATLDVFRNASKSASFMTPPSRGWRLMRDAALSLALTEPFAAELANPRQMTPYTYGESPLAAADRDAFDGGPPPGAVAPDPKVDDGFLSEKLGGAAVLLFGASDGLEALEGIQGLQVLRLPLGGEAASAYDAREGTAYLIRPDMYVAARWRQVDVDSLLTALRDLFDWRSAP